MKIDFRKLADQVVKIGGPIVAAAVAHKLATGKLDVKAAALSAVDQAATAAGLSPDIVALIRQNVLKVA